MNLGKYQEAIKFYDLYLERIERDMVTENYKG